MTGASFEGHGHGKLILCGEHAVVYGYPALAMAVDRGTRVVLTAHSGPTAVHGDLDDPRLMAAIRVILPEVGWDVRITTDLPVGRGMGSSAALAVALVRAESASRGHTPDASEVFDRAFAVERVFHGNPSGLDHAVSAMGGLLRYRRGSPPSFEPLPPPSWRLVVLDSGVAGDTGALVAGVASRRPGVDADLDRIGALVQEATLALHDPRALGPLLTENHRLLRAIGVSTPALDDLVALALGAGAYGAKLAGAGGGGVVLALVEDPSPVLAAAKRAGVLAFATRPA